ncbi:MAG: hypothetical protein GY810_09565 [Aureispira sp.]|nr:hypothetical protein [Aureispira sp.]
MKWILTLLAFAHIATNLSAQEAISKKMRFKNGVYTSFDDFHQNKPLYKLGQVKYFDYNLDKEKNILFLDNLAIEELPYSDIKSLENIWGICVKGIPYIKVIPEVQSSKNEVYFVQFYVLGSISYFYYQTFVNKTVMMAIYNPITGTKVAEKPIVNKEKVLVKKILNFQTGQIKTFNKENVKNWIANDSKLTESIDKLNDDEIEEKLFKTLLIYNDRNPVYLE